MRARSCSSIWRSKTCAAPPTCSCRSTNAPTASTGGSRSRSRRCSRTTPRDRRGGQGRCTRAPGGRNLFIKIPGTPEGLPAITEAIAAGVPVNVTLLFSADQYRGGGRRLPERRRAPGRRRPRPGRRARSRRCSCRAGTPRWPTGARRAARTDLGLAVGLDVYRAYRELMDSDRCAAAGERRRANAAAAVGQHEHEGPDRVRHALRARPGRAVHRQHHARRHPGGLLRPRRGRRAAAGRRRRRRRAARAVRRARRRPRRARGQAAERRREVLRRRLERPDGRIDAQSRRWRCMASSLCASDRPGRRSNSTTPRSSRATSASCSPTIPSAASGSRPRRVGLYLDYSKNRITDETMRLLLQLAEESGLREHTDADVPRRHDQRLRAPVGAARRAADAEGHVARRRRRRRRRGGARGARPRWRRSATRSGRGSGRATPASRSRTSSTSASAAPTSAR